MHHSTPHTQNTCLRCGTCCRKGGPSFHIEDRDLIDNGKIPVKFLFTIRKGELAHDNVKGIHYPVDADIIKIKGKAAGTWACVFLNEKTNDCAIYEHRPLECRVLKCWNTAEITNVYNRARLSRENLLSGIEGLWELVADHQQKCDDAKLRGWVDALRTREAQTAQEKICETIAYDDQVRKRVVAKTDLQPNQLDFLFGRPLVQTVALFGLKCMAKGDKYIITSIR